MITLYKRNAQGKPLVWSITKYAKQVGAGIREEIIEVSYGLVGGNLHKEIIPVTLKNVNELESRVKAKRKEGYKEVTELRDNISNDDVMLVINSEPALLHYLETYLPKYSTTSEGFVLPMLAKILENNKPFDRIGTMSGQWKINGLRCIIGAKADYTDMFVPVKLTYHSREGEDWTAKMSWMDDIIYPKLGTKLVEMMVEEGACLDGELYLPGYNVNDINSFVKNPGLPQHYKLQYWCYDICCESMTARLRSDFIYDSFKHNFDYKNIDDFYPHFENRDEHLNNKNQLVLLPSWDISSIGEATIFRDKFIDLGFEGLILRNPSAEYQFDKRNSAMFKFKKIDDGKFIIVDIKSEHKRSDLPLFVLRNDINDELFECSINKPHDVQREILINKDKYVGKYMFVEYRERSGINSLPFHARGIDIVD